MFHGGVLKVAGWGEEMNPRELVERGAAKKNAGG